LRQPQLAQNANLRQNVATKLRENFNGFFFRVAAAATRAKQKLSDLRQPQPKSKKLEKNMPQLGKNEENYGEKN